MKFHSYFARFTQPQRVQRSLALLLLLSLSLGLLAVFNPAPAARAQDAETATPEPTLEPTAAPVVDTAAPPAVEPSEAPSAEPGASPEPTSGIWNTPENVTQSGSATMPSMAVEPDGRLHMLWWDQFDGATYRYRDTDGTWSDPSLAVGIYGARVRLTNGKIDVTPPTELTIMADGDNHVYALWRLSTGDLMFSHTDVPSPKLTSGSRLITNPLLWKLFIASDNSLNLVYIRTLSTGNVEPGVYYRRSRNGIDWTDPVLIASSLYFRTLQQGDANVTVFTDGADQVLVGWDDPQSGQSFYALSKDRGQTFDEPAAVEAGGVAEVALPTRVRFIYVADQGFIRFWEAGDSCVLYQQTLNEDGTWTPPIRAIEQVNGCYRAQTAYSVSEGRLFMILGVKSTAQTVLTAWDGQKWAEPESPQASFVDPGTGDFVALSCVTMTLSKLSVVLMGCDRQGDVWVLTSHDTPDAFLPVVESSWGQPTVLSKGPGDAGLPTIAVDQQERFHVMWSQLPAPGNPGASIAYLRGTGGQWTDVSNIIRVPDGNVRALSLLADPNAILHLAWSGGTTGQVYYNQAFERDSLLADYWGRARPLPAVQPIGDSPNIALTPSGKLYAIYTVPYNEGRGLYFISSTDLGQTWSDPVRVFDAAAAGWGVIHQASLAIDQQEHLHVAWSKAASPNQDSPQGVYYSQSVDGGATWMPAVTVTASSDSDPKLIVSSNNDVHLVWIHNTANGRNLLHQWSGDGGQTWSPAIPVPGVGIVAPEIGLTADTTGSVYLSGIELTKQASAALFYVRWNGESWTDQDVLRLGYDFNTDSGVRLATLPSGQLGIFYRVLAPTGAGTAAFVVGYVGRQLNRGTDFTPAPTFTPRPTITPLPAATSAPTLTPIAFQNDQGGGAGGNSSVLLQIGAVVAFMVVVSAIAIIRLGGRISRS